MTIDRSLPRGPRTSHRARARDVLTDEQLAAVTGGAESGVQVIPNEERSRGM